MLIAGITLIVLAAATDVSVAIILLVCKLNPNSRKFAAIGLFIQALLAVSALILFLVAYEK